MKKLNRILSFVIALFLAVMCNGVMSSGNLYAYRLVNGEKIHSIIGDRIIYATEEAFDETIVTFEATIKLPKALAILRAELLWEITITFKSGTERHVTLR